MDIETPEDVLKSVAADIKRYGHFQKQHMGGSSLHGAGNPAGLCCVNVNPTTRSTPVGLQGNATHLLRERIEALTGLRNEVHWNDNTPTDEVLKVLEGA